MESIALWFAGTLGKYISSKLAVFIVSLVPILECRGGLIASALLKVDIRYADTSMYSRKYLTNSIYFIIY